MQFCHLGSDSFTKKTMGASVNKLSEGSLADIGDFFLVRSYPNFGKNGNLGTLDVADITFTPIPLV